MKLMSLMSAALGLVAISLVGCGEGPSFVDVGGGGTSSQREVSDTGQNQPGGPGDVVVAGGGSGGGSGGGGNNGGGNNGGNGGGSGGGGSNGSGNNGGGNNGGGGNTVVIPNNPSDPNSPGFVVPDATPEEVDQIRKCVMNWKNVPFVGEVTNVRRIRAAVTVGGIGNAISDTTQTTSPTLVLVDAAVNVLGSPTYDFLNQNAYYCMKVNVNVLTQFNINLACNARLADSSVNVNVGSTTNSDTAGVGVSVGSNVSVNRMTPSRQQCQD